MTDTGGQSYAGPENRTKRGYIADIDDSQFDDWARLLEHRIGLFIAPERKSFLASGLRARMRETGCRDYREYYRQLSGAAQAKEWSMLVDCLTVHETCFFRHAPSLELVKDVVLPEACERGAHFNAWSIGCATGEETYSLAMVIDAYRSKQRKDVWYGVTGTDISLPALHRARKGIYSERRLARISAEFQAKYTRSISGNRFEVAATLRERVCFAQLNLRGIESAPFAGMDLIYCQNVLIYYDRKRRVDLVNRLVRFLRPGGVLLLGPGELLHWQHPEMEKVACADTLAYRRIQEQARNAG